MREEGKDEKVGITKNSFNLPILDSIKLTIVNQVDKGFVLFPILFFSFLFNECCRTRVGIYNNSL